MLSTIKPLKEKIQGSFSKDYTLASLRLFIIAWAIFIIVISLIIDNKYILAGIIAYEVLP
jgi:hypothetical protein